MSRAAPNSSALASFLGTIGLLSLVFLAFSLSAKLKSALEDELASRLRVAAKLALAVASELESPRANDPWVMARLDEVRQTALVSTIALYDAKGRALAVVGGAAGEDAIPRQIRVHRKNAGPADITSRVPDLDGGGGLSLLVPGTNQREVGAVLVRLEPGDLGALATVRVLFHVGRILAGIVILAGILILLRWASPKGGAVPVRPAPAPSSDVEMVLGTMKEVMHSLKDSETEYKEMWTAAERDAEHFRKTSASIVESISSGIVAFDAAGRVTLFNRAAESVLAFDGRASIGRPLADVFGEKDPVTNLGAELLEGRGAASRLEIARPSADGAARWIGVSSSVLPRNDGEPAGGILLVTDLTEAKRSREQEELKDRLSAVGEMSAGIAHEIKNSLHSLLGFANLLREDARGSELPLPVRGILEEMRALEAMVKRILEFAKPSNLSRERVSSNRLIEEAAAAVREEARAADVDVTLDLAPGTPEIFADALAMRGALVNLAANAIQAMDEATKSGTTAADTQRERGTLTITSRSADSFGGDLRITVRDTGPGIPEADRAKVFAPFFSTKRAGIGLGLALVQKTIADHGGRIQVHSRLGVCTEFVVAIPAAVEPAPTPASSSRAEASA